MCSSVQIVISGEIDFTFLNIWVSRSTKKRFLGTAVPVYQQIGNNLWSAKTKKGLRDKNYMTANYTPILWSILINMLEGNEWISPISTGEWRIYLRTKMHVLTINMIKQCNLLNWDSVIHNAVICMNDSNYAWREL